MAKQYGKETEIREQLQNFIWKNSHLRAIIYILLKPIYLICIYLFCTSSLTWQLMSHSKNELNTKNKE